MLPRDEITTKMFAKRNRMLVLVCRLTGVPADDIMSRCRRQDIATARQLVMWALVTLCGYTHTQTGILMRRNHATVTNAVRWVNKGYGGKDVERLRQEVEKKFQNF